MNCCDELAIHDLRRNKMRRDEMLLVEKLTRHGRSILLVAAQCLKGCRIEKLEKRLLL